MGEGVTVYDVQQFGSNRSRRELPRVIAGVLRLTWSAGRRELVTVVVLEALAAVGVAALVLLGRDVLTGVLAGDRQDTGWEGLVPDLVALAALSTLLTVGQAVVCASTSSCPSSPLAMRRRGSSTSPARSSCARSTTRRSTIASRVRRAPSSARSRSSTEWSH